MTLQEAKDQIAKKYGFADFSRIDTYKILGSVYSPQSVNDEVAELYARSKWDEGCEAMRYRMVNGWISCARDPNAEYRAMKDMAKPEFKP